MTDFQQEALEFCHICRASGALLLGCQRHSAGISVAFGENVMKRPSPFFLTSLATLGLLSGGCSYAFVDAPPKHHEQLPYFECTSGRGWPTTDLVLGLVYGVTSIMSFANSSSAGSSTEGVMAASVSALFLASSYSGYGKAQECRDAKDELMLRLTRQSAGYGAGFQPAPYDPWLTPPPGAFGKSPTPQAPPAQPKEAPTP
jgi:hypothetical protein